MADCEFPYDFPFYLGGCGTGTSEALISQYQDQALKLLPPGRGITKALEIGGVLTNVGKFLKAFAVEFARVHERGADLYRESFPGDATAVDLLMDWETFVGLPNECTAYLTTEADRQDAILKRFAVSEGQSEADFKAIALDIGYTIDVARYEVWRCGKTPISKPIRHTPWLFASQMSYETTGTTQDAVLECTLDEHKHLYTHINYNGWTEAATAGLTNLRHHYVHGEFVESGGEITTWTNRVTPANSWDTGGPDLPVATQVFGWNGCGLYVSPDDKEISGLDHSAPGSTDANTLLQEDDFQCWIVFYMEELVVGGIILTDGTDITVAVDNDGSGGYECNFTYGATTLTEPIALAHPCMVTIGADAGTAYLRTNDRTGVSGAHAASVTGDQGLTLGDTTTGFRGVIFEMVSADYTGTYVQADVAATTAYLMNKYNLPT